MEPQTRDIESERNAAVALLATYLHDETGVNEETARARARDAVREAHEAVAHKESGITGWAFGLRGLLSIAAGVIFVLRPIETVFAIVFVLGAWILVDGIIEIASAIANRDWSAAPYGAIGVLVGYLIFTRTQGAISVFFILAAVWVLARGAAEIGQAVKMHRGDRGRGSLMFLGVISFAFGLLLLAAPVLGAVALGLWLGAFALINGVVSVFRAFQLRRVSEDVKDVWLGRRAQQVS